MWVHILLLAIVLLVVFYVVRLLMMAPAVTPQLILQAIGILLAMIFLVYVLGLLGIATWPAMR